VRQWRELGLAWAHVKFEPDWVLGTVRATRYLLIPWVV
jgi:hypothetical protein